MKKNCCIFRTREAESGNRPRFKPRGSCTCSKKNSSQAATAFSRTWQLTNLKRGARGSSRQQQLLLLLLVLLQISLNWQPVNCDQWARPYRNVHLKRRLLLQTNAGESMRDLSRVQLDASSDARHQLKVTAFASKLEQWFVCRKLVSAHLVQNASHCPAHFDGHLCWLPSEPGRIGQSLCPKLNWLQFDDKQPAEQEQSFKSVITKAAAAAAAPAPVQGLLPNGPQDDAGTEQTPAITQPANNQRQQQEKVLFAYRKCERDIKQKSNLMLASTQQAGPKVKEEAILRARWQEKADYSACKEGTTGHDQQFDPTDKWINLNEKEDKQVFDRLVLELDRVEATSDPYSDPDLLEQWTLCIGNIMREQEQFISTTITIASQQQPGRPAPETAPDWSNSSTLARGDLWCPIIFDGWRCWPSTRAAEVAYVSCPRNQPGFSAERKAHKICTANGTWYKHPMTNRYWSNYTTCVDTVDLAFRTKILNLYVIGNLISLVALSASLIIFVSFKSLSCTRVTIHKNLFLSFITNNLMWIIWYTYVVNDADLLQSNPIECQFWHILLHYFLVSNYFWMFCEGLYLHTLLVVAFVSEDKILKWFYLLGWLTPVPITVAYAYNRSYDDYYTNFCWMEESPYNLILMAPIGLSLLLNLVFLINIVRVLVTKLRANNSPDTHQTRKAVRATLILIPLLGLHYILTPFRPEAKSEWEVIYESVAAACTSFQGLCVALLFCFCNGEVITVIKKKLKDTFNHSRLNSSPSGQMRTRSNTGASLLGAPIQTSLTSEELEGNTISQRFRSVMISTTSNGQQQQQQQPANYSMAASLTNGGSQALERKLESVVNRSNSSDSSNSSPLLVATTLPPTNQSSPDHLLLPALPTNSCSPIPIPTPAALHASSSQQNSSRSDRDKAQQTHLHQPDFSLTSGLTSSEIHNLISEKGLPGENHNLQNYSLTTSFSASSPSHIQ